MQLLGAPLAPYSFPRRGRPRFTARPPRFAPDTPRKPRRRNVRLVANPHREALMPDVHTLIILCPLVFLGSFVDAIGGGGGLITLPAYLLVGLPAHLAIGTNKLSSMVGTSFSAARYIRNGFVDWRLAVPCVACALAASLVGGTLLDAFARGALPLGPHLCPSGGRRRHPQKEVPAPGVRPHAEAPPRGNHVRGRPPVRPLRRVLWARDRHVPHPRVLRARAARCAGLRRTDQVREPREQHRRLRVLPCRGAVLVRPRRRRVGLFHRGPLSRRWYGRARRFAHRPPHHRLRPRGPLCKDDRRVARPRRVGARRSLPSRPRRSPGLLGGPSAKDSGVVVPLAKNSVLVGPFAKKA
ncbi:MAG: sulfite exporter TauE/SafE family protein [Atopobiaceae bacterium]|nr:sulfite exporter TauE/SafE family protein [Atopobiaceae bacterium]